MRVVVISDTHLPRFGRRLPAILERVVAERPDLILHLGDFTEPAAAAPFEAIAPFDAVAGNNDGPRIVRRFGRAKIRELAGLRVGLVHGDCGRGSTLERARGAFAGEQLTAILFGHSHSPLCELRAGTWLLNPGSPTDKRREARYSYALVDIRDGVFEPRLVFFD